MREAIKENNHYQRYQELGGIINEKDYESALARAENTGVNHVGFTPAMHPTWCMATTLNPTLIKQLEHIAEFAGIELHNTKNAIDQRIILYAILRADTKTKEEAEYHYSDMSDQRLFAEALRMSGDIDSLNKLINAYPNIAFNRELKDASVGK